MKNSTMPLADDATALRAKIAALEDKLVKVREVAHENFAYLEGQISTLTEQNAALQEKLSRRGRAGRKPIGSQAQTGTERSRKSRKRKAEFGP